MFVCWWWGWVCVVNQYLLLNGIDTEFIFIRCCFFPSTGKLCKIESVLKPRVIPGFMNCCTSYEGGFLYLRFLSAMSRRTRPFQRAFCPKYATSAPPPQAPCWASGRAGGGHHRKRNFRDSFSVYFAIFMYCLISLIMLFNGDMLSVRWCIQLWLLFTLRIQPALIFTYIYASARAHTPKRTFTRAPTHKHTHERIQTRALSPHARTP